MQIIFYYKARYCSNWCHFMLNLLSAQCWSTRENTETIGPSDLKRQWGELKDEKLPTWLGYETKSEVTILSGSVFKFPPTPQFISFILSTVVPVCPEARNRTVVKHWVNKITIKLKHTVSQGLSPYFQLLLLNLCGPQYQGYLQSGRILHPWK